MPTRHRSFQGWYDGSPHGIHPPPPDDIFFPRESHLHHHGAFTVIGWRLSRSNGETLTPLGWRDEVWPLLTRKTHAWNIHPTLKINILHIIMEVWFRSCSFLFMGDGCRFQIDGTGSWKMIFFWKKWSLFDMRSFAVGVEAMWAKHCNSSFLTMIDTYLNLDQKC